MRSMTGFGLGRATLHEGVLELEIRALNHRFQDVRLRLPPELAEQSFFLEQLARKRLGRGRFDLSVRVSGTAFPAPELAVDEAKRLYQALVALRDELAPGTDVPITALFSLPGALRAVAVDADAVRAALEASFAEAAIRLDRMREQEGSALAGELESRLALARKLVADIEASSAELLEHHALRLRERVEKLLRDSGVQVNPERLEQEIALLADKSDITEELVRLGSHFVQMSELFAIDEPVGRKLDFLLQEVGREVNTIGSKSQHAPVAHRVVELKTEVERLREQIQNVD